MKFMLTAEKGEPWLSDFHLLYSEIYYLRLTLDFNYWKQLYFSLIKRNMYTTWLIILYLQSGFEEIIFPLMALYLK